MFDKNWQDIGDIRMQEVCEGEEGFNSAIKIFRSDPGTIQEKVQEVLVRENWWLQKYWMEKGFPREQISISIGGEDIDIYNWSDEPLTDEQVNTLVEILKIFLIIANGKALKNCRYILIDNIQAISTVSGEEMNGYGALYDRAIYLYPRALRPIEHRVKGVSNLAGTLIHELTHNLTEDIESEWIEKFGWQWLDTPRILPGGYESFFQVDNPERCISEYARSKPNEDISDSMVAAIKNPDILDREKLDFLRERLFQPGDSRRIEIIPSVVKHNGETLNIPKIESPVRYRIVG